MKPPPGGTVAGTGCADNVALGLFSLLVLFVYSEVAERYGALRQTARALPPLTQLGLVAGLVLALPGTALWRRGDGRATTTVRLGVFLVFPLVVVAGAYWQLRSDFDLPRWRMEGGELMLYVCLLLAYVASSAALILVIRALRSRRAVAGRHTA